MIIKPPLTELEIHVDSKYTLVSLSAKRARQLIDGKTPSVPVSETENYVSVALEEIANGDIGYVRTREGIK